MKSIELENLTWIEAEETINSYEVALIALGARTKEHGPHLQLNNDFLLAEFLKEQVKDKIPTIVLPTLQYGYYPAFTEYPGSITLKKETFCSIVVEICQSMSLYGIKKFYILNTGVSTLLPLEQAAKILGEENITLKYFNVLDISKELPDNLLVQEGGSHADEEETSIMLHIAPDTVDMSKAVKDLDLRPNRRGLTRDPKGDGHFSPTGIWGDPTVATREKGKVIVDIMISAIVKQINEMIE
ncbi:MAG: creatininase family protein [Candidatus Heimdallarchaeota archaeon]|nr:MAG: creatininase family protein [Candidatus Heimdallarchaeota archaeon]